MGTLPSVSRSQALAHKVTGSQSQHHPRRLLVPKRTKRSRSEARREPCGVGSRPEQARVVCRGDVTSGLVAAGAAGRPNRRRALDLAHGLTARRPSRRPCAPTAATCAPTSSAFALQP